MKKEHFAAVLVSIAILLLVIVLLVPFKAPQNYAFEENREGVIFRSNSTEPSVFLNEFIASNKVLVSVQFLEDGSITPQMTSALTLLSAIFSFNQKNTVLLGQELSNGELKRCISNDGDKKEQREISAKDCLKELSDPFVPKVIVFLPDSSLSEPVVLIEERKVSIFSSTPENSFFACVKFLDVLFEGNKETVNLINELLSKSIPK
jgi:hypothetical protein